MFSCFLPITGMYLKTSSISILVNPRSDTVCTLPLRLALLISCRRHPRSPARVYTTSDTSAWHLDYLPSSTSRCGQRVFARPSSLCFFNSVLSWIGCLIMYGFLLRRRDFLHELSWPRVWLLKWPGMVVLKQIQIKKRFISFRIIHFHKNSSERKKTAHSRSRLCVSISSYKQGLENWN